MNVLVDTSVWVNHFKARNDALVRLIEADRALVHPMIVAELACGTPPEPRIRTLGDIDLLLPSNQATLAEVREFIEREKLYGLGCGLVDITLLASTLITSDAQLWTLDKRLAGLAKRFGIAYRSMPH
ncbi:MAG: PIN domain-containing protein [Acidihalobacter sp.]|uniref:type II toxin-antitoxin system VapC family toxin n=1 Tax=Acidihalobacter sp. TaxID=1872108 RepID=UPI00307EC162